MTTTASFSTRHLMISLLTMAMATAVSACVTSVGVGSRSAGWYHIHDRSPFYRCCRYSPPIIISPGPEPGPGPEPELPIEPPRFEAVPLPSGGFDGDFGGDFGGGDFGDGNFGGAAEF